MTKDTVDLINLVADIRKAKSSKDIIDATNRLNFVMDGVMATNEKIRERLSRKRKMALDKKYKTIKRVEL